MESIDEKRLRILKKKLEPIKKITLNDIRKYPDAEIVVRQARMNCNHILDVDKKQKSIEIKDYKVKNIVKR